MGSGGVSESSVSSWSWGGLGGGTMLTSLTFLGGNGGGGDAFSEFNFDIR